MHKVLFVEGAWLTFGAKMVIWIVYARPRPCSAHPHAPRASQCLGTSLMLSQVNVVPFICLADQGTLLVCLESSFYQSFRILLISLV